MIQKSEITYESPIRHNDLLSFFPSPGEGQVREGLPYEFDIPNSAWTRSSIHPSNQLNPGHWIFFSSAAALFFSSTQQDKAARPASRGRQRSRSHSTRLRFFSFNSSRNGGG